MKITKDKLVDNQEFHSMYQLTKNIIFEVNYYTLGSNKHANFTTNAGLLNRPKSDYNQCGQAQESLLPEGSEARAFYDKWDKLHLSDLDEKQYNAMIEDLNVLMEKYNVELYDNARDSIPFYEVVDFSKQTPKDKIKPKRVAKAKTTTKSKARPVS